MEKNLLSINASKTGITLKKEVPTNIKIKRILKQAIFDQY